jgi:LacI family transcriptional regulator
MSTTSFQSDPPKFALAAPLPPRASASALRQQLLDHIVRARAVVGQRFLSDHELARIAQLSRPTVRKALDHLEREGWIERRPGIGTFIGPRAAMDLSVASAPHHPRVLRTAATRLALMIHLMGDLGHDWYAAGVINGIDAAAEEAGISLELLGDRVGDVKSVSRRLQQTRPDVLAVAAPTLRHMGIFFEATRLGIPCIGTGTLVARIGIPSIVEDNVSASKLAVKHLLEQGHRRIGYITAPYSLPWVFDRRQGYVDGLTEAGCEADESMVLWLSTTGQEERARELEQYLDRRKPTAIIFTSWSLVDALAPMVRQGRISIPRDLSVVTFDQSPQVVNWLGCKPTVISIPLAEMGKQLAHAAHDLAAGKDVQQQIVLNCNLVEGESVLNMST